MTACCAESLVAVAFSHTAEVAAWRLTMTGEEREHVERTLRNLFHVGHIAAFSIRCSDAGVVSELVEQLRSRVGALVLRACSDGLEGPPEPPPAFLMPVWNFDHAIAGQPAATGRLLGIDLELIATPSPDEEVGAHLSGRAGRWLIHARPMF